MKEALPGSRGGGKQERRWREKKKVGEGVRMERKMKGGGKKRRIGTAI